jgi:putative restriction endonuclease
VYERVRSAGLKEMNRAYPPLDLFARRIALLIACVLVTDIYARRCAVTRERTLPALEAAHIRPYGDGGAHEAKNGILLLRDIHHLFDAGYVAVAPDLRFEISRRIREEFENGKNHYAMHGQKIEPPKRLTEKELSDLSGL